MIHPTAIVDPAARIAPGVSIGPWCTIGAEVEIGEGTRVAAHVVLEGPTRIGRDNQIHAFSSLGGVPQDKKFAGERSALEIGDRNVIREYCTFNRGTAHGGGTTRIGDDNWIMAYVHFAHDCVIGSHTIMANGATLAGHVEVADRVCLGAFTVVHQFCAIGCHAFSAMGTVVFKDVPPYVTVAGNPAAARGVNAEGLKRSGVAPDAIVALRRAYKLVYKQGLKLETAIARLADLEPECREVAPLREFLRRPGRGIVR